MKIKDLHLLLFVELPSFEKNREKYLDDSDYRNLQLELMKNPTKGSLIKGTGRLRKIRYKDECRSKGKRGGLRIIYYYHVDSSEIWLFTVYSKDEATDLTQEQKKLVKTVLELEINARKK